MRFTSFYMQVFCLLPPGGIEIIANRQNKHNVNKRLGVAKCMMSTNSKSGCASCFATPQIGKARLLLVLAQSLHCTGFYQRVYNSTRVHTATIFGIRSHLERVALLYGLLAPVMITKAQTVKAENWHESTVVRRRSFMTGFASRIGERLAAAEDAMAQQSTGYALALRDDVTAAQQAAERFAEASQLTLSADRAQRMFDSAAYVRGQCAGDATDIGQVRVQAKPALPF